MSTGAGTVSYHACVWIFVSVAYETATHGDPILGGSFLGAHINIS